jgi:hypothetical protein
LAENVVSHTGKFLKLILSKAKTLSKIKKYS